MTGVIGKMIKAGLVEMEEESGLFNTLDMELEQHLDQIEADNTDSEIRMDDGSVFVVAHNGMSEDMKEIDALYIIESEMLHRSAIIRVTWETATPKEPKDITIEFCTDVETFRKRRIEEARKFRGELADGDYCKRDMDMGLIKHRGYCTLEQPGGVADNLTSTLGRHAASVIAFMKGSDKYKAEDLSYDNSWGSW